MKTLSLVPSITYSLLDLGLPSEDLVGRTKFCIYPKSKVQNIPVFGGTKNVKVDRISALQGVKSPDLIIANKEENTKEEIEILASVYPVWLTDIKNLEDNNLFLVELCTKVNLPADPIRINHDNNRTIQNHRASKPKSVAYVIWKKPWMVAGGDTYISSVLEALGFNNYFKNCTRYPQVTWEEICNAELIFLSSEPYPFKMKDLLFFTESLNRENKNSEIKLVSGEYFSWFGSYLAKANHFILQT